MKKNKMMRAASALLVAVLLTTSVISGTFAKYVTSDEATDSARVAKWGVEIEANGEAFATTYEAHDDETEFELTVVTDPEGDGKKLVAPGTSHDLVAMVLSGKPEVAVKVEYEATLTLEKWLVEDDEEYCPLIFTVNEEEYYIGKDGISSVAELTEAVEEAIEGYSAEYAANTNLSEETTVATPDVSWEWPFEVGTGDVLKANDEKDTYLGDQAAKGNAATITLEITTTVTQID